MKFLSKVVAGMTVALIVVIVVMVMIAIVLGLYDLVLWLLSIAQGHPVSFIF